MKVSLIRYTDDPREVIVGAARLCYSRKDFSSLAENNPEFIKKLVKMGHTSPLEHASFTFLIEGISLVCSHQLVRHRIASYTMESHRRIEARDYTYPSSLDEFGYMFEEVIANYEKLIKLGVPKEDARYILPCGIQTRIIMTMNARSLLNFFSQRLKADAQDEIREMAEKMKAILIEKDLLSEVWESA